MLFATRLNSILHNRWEGYFDSGTKKLKQSKNYSGLTSSGCTNQLRLIFCANRDLNLQNRLINELEFE